MGRDGCGGPRWSDGPDRRGDDGGDPVGANDPDDQEAMR